MIPPGGVPMVMGAIDGTVLAAHPDRPAFMAKALAKPVIAFLTFCGDNKVGFHGKVVTVTIALQDVPGPDGHLPGCDCGKEHP